MFWIKGFCSSTQDLTPNIIRIFCIIVLTSLKCDMASKHRGVNVRALFCCWFSVSPKTGDSSQKFAFLKLGRKRKTRTARTTRRQSINSEASIKALNSSVVLLQHTPQVLVILLHSVYVILSCQNNIIVFNLALERRVRKL